MSKPAGVRRRIALATVAAACALHSPPGASADNVTLTVIGKGNTDAVHFVVEDAWLLPDQVPTFFGSGSYLGAVIERVYPDHAFVAAAFRAKALGDQPVWVFGDTTLKAGRYAAHLFSDRPGRVSFPMSGLQGLNFTTHNRLPVRVTTASGALAVGVTDVELRLPGGVPIGKRALLARRVGGNRVEQTWSCVTFQSSCPPEPVDLPQGLARVEPPATVPSATDDASLRYAPRSAEARQAYVGVSGARLKSETLRGVLVVYGR